MGHTDIHRIVKADRLGKRPSSQQIVDMALNDWYDDPDDDRGSANVWGSYTTAPSSEDHAWMLSSARRAAHHARNGLDEAIITPIPRDSDIVHTKKNITMKVKGALADRLRSTYSYDERNALSAQISADTGKRVVALKITKFPTRKKAKAVATEGKSVTVYDVIGHDPTRQRETRVAAGIDTFPNAKAKAVELAGDSSMDDYSQFFVRARIQRVLEDGTSNQDMAVITRPVADEVSITVEVTFETVKASWKVDRYQVVFDIHH